MQHSHNSRPTPKAPDASYLERAALYYLERFASSCANLEAVLKRKIMRRCKARGESPEPYYENIAPLIERYVASGLINDVVYAQAKVASLRRKGTSGRMIASKLAHKGVPRSLISAQIEEHAMSELEAACAFARRKKLGHNPDMRMRDLAALARAGFSYDVSKKALEESCRSPAVDL